MASQGNAARLSEQSTTPADSTGAVDTPMHPNNDFASSDNYVGQMMRAIHCHQSGELVARNQQLENDFGHQQSRVAQLEEGFAKLVDRQTSVEQTIRKLEDTSVKRSEFEEMINEIKDHVVENCQNKSFFTRMESKLDRVLDNECSSHDQSQIETTASARGASTAQNFVDSSNQPSDKSRNLSPVFALDTRTGTGRQLLQDRVGYSVTGSPALTTNANFGILDIAASTPGDNLYDTSQTQSDNVSRLEDHQRPVGSRYRHLNEGYMAGILSRLHICAWNAIGTCPAKPCTFSHKPEDYAATYLAALNRCSTNERVEHVHPPCIWYVVNGHCDHGRGDKRYSHKFANVLTIVEKYFKNHDTDISLDEYLRLLRRPDPSAESSGWSIRGRAGGNGNHLKREHTTYGGEVLKRHRFN
ncbi:MAG: hypothetical protein M1831_005481 [Alyxoria varia]|nr:MAG: hypothetical protein M1831_005481 [Alyxoria varia]